MSTDSLIPGVTIALSMGTAVNTSLYMVAERVEVPFSKSVDLIDTLVLTGAGTLLATVFYVLLDRLFPRHAMKVWCTVVALELMASLALHEFIAGLMHVTPAAALFVVFRASRSMAGR